jgi:hypothetical protein
MMAAVKISCDVVGLRPWCLRKRPLVPNLAAVFFMIDRDECTPVDHVGPWRSGLVSDEVSVAALFGGGVAEG